MNCKKHYNILIDASSKKDSQRKIKIKDNSGNILYVGIEYYLWNIIKQDFIKRNYSFTEYFSEFTNFTKITQDVINEKYDFAIGSFATTEKRLESGIGYSTLIWLDSNTFLYYKKNNYFNIIKNIFIKILIYPIILFLILGILFGIILTYISPERKQIFGNKKIITDNMLKRNILTSIVAFFGELGFIHENATLKTKGIIIIIFIFILTFSMMFIIQSLTTDLVLEQTNIDNISIKNIEYQKPFLCIEGYSVGKHFENIGAKVIYKKVDKIKEIVQHYKNNKNNFSGVLLGMENAVRFAELDKNLVYNTNNFGFREQSIIYNKKNVCESLIKNINLNILKSQKNLDIYNLCKRFYKDDISHLCLI
tara:strand:+ start:1002 stop:2096 length:1095 start_codon:yes stop_codon:yes gene_type:complete